MPLKTAGYSFGFPAPASSRPSPRNPAGQLGLSLPFLFLLFFNNFHLRCPEALGRQPWLRLSMCSPWLHPVTCRSRGPVICPQCDSRLSICLCHCRPLSSKPVLVVLSLRRRLELAFPCHSFSTGLLCRQKAALAHLPPTSSSLMTLPKLLLIRLMLNH